MTEVFLNRGLSKEEVRALLTAPMDDRERAFYRAIYETFYRAQELLKCNIEDYDKRSGELVARFPKRKYNPRTKKTIVEPPKHMVLSPSTQALFNKIISKRKKGPVFITSRGNRVLVRFFQKHVDELALRQGLQKLTHITDTGRAYKLFSLKALREAGERHTDLEGGDYETTAKAAQHSLRIKEKHYKKTSWDEIQMTIKKHHPAFKGEV